MRKCYRNEMRAEKYTLHFIYIYEYTKKYKLTVIQGNTFQISDGQIQPLKFQWPNQIVQKVFIPHCRCSYAYIYKIGYDK